MEFKNTIRSEADDKYSNMLDGFTASPYSSEPEVASAEAYRDKKQRYGARLEKEMYNFNNAVQKVNKAYSDRTAAERQEASDKEAKSHKRGLVLKTIALLLPLLLCAIIGFDVFNVWHGQMYNIKIHLAWQIVIYVVACGLAILFSVLSIKKMYENDTPGKKKAGKPYKALAIVALIVFALLAVVNGLFIAKYSDYYRVTFRGGKDARTEYVKKGDSLYLTNSFKPNKKHDEYFTTYTFEGWMIDGELHSENYEKFTPQKSVAAKAIFTPVDWVGIFVRVGGATLTLTYNGKSTTYEEISTTVNVEVGTEITISATFLYSDTKLNVNDRSVSNPYTFTLKKEYTSIYAGSSNPSCLAEGTRITLADGSNKAVEDLQMGDNLLVFNHETGSYEAMPLLVNVHAGKPAEDYEVINLAFSNGNKLRIIDEHGLFDKDLNRYVYINNENAKDFVGHRFVAVSAQDGRAESEIVTLVSAEITKEHIRIFNPASVWHINLVADDMLTLSAGMVNFFEYDENMKYDEQAMQRDIERYGVYEYEEFQDYVSREVFEAFPFKYYKVAIERGDFTFSRLLGLIYLYQDDESLR